MAVRSPGFYFERGRHMKKKEDKKGAESVNGLEGEFLSDVLSLEVLGPLKRALELWDGGSGGDTDEMYAIRDAYLLAKDNMNAVCDVIQRDIGHLRIDAAWGRSFLEKRSYEKAFIVKEKVRV